MLIAHNEGRDWRKDMQKFLLGYSSTPHTTTGLSPAKLLFGREIRSKLPGVEDLRSASNDSEVLDRDRERKQKGKDYADNLRGACESNLKEGDKVLLQKPKSDKPSSSFETTPYEVVNKQGSQVEIKSPVGVHYKRNVTHLQKRVNHRKQWPVMLKEHYQKTRKLVRKMNREFQINIMRCDPGAIVSGRG